MCANKKAKLTIAQEGNVKTMHAVLQAASVYAPMSTHRQLPVDMHAMSEYMRMPVHAHEHGYVHMSTNAAATAATAAAKAYCYYCYC